MSRKTVLLFPGYGTLSPGSAEKHDPGSTGIGGHLGAAREFATERRVDDGQGR